MWNDKKVEISIYAFSNAKIPKKKHIFLYIKNFHFGSVHTNQSSWLCSQVDVIQCVVR